MIAPARARPNRSTVPESGFRLIREAARFRTLLENLRFWARRVRECGGVDRAAATSNGGGVRPNGHVLRQMSERRFARSIDARGSGRPRSGCPAVFLILASLWAPHTARAQIGIVAGYNRDSIEDFVPTNGFDFTDRSNGFHIGIFFNVNVGPVGIRPAVVYHQVPDLIASTVEDRTQFDLELVEIPLDLRLRIPIPIIRPYVLAGPVFSFPSTSVTSVDDLLEPRPVRAEFGIGMELNLGFRLWPEIRYGRGLGRLMRSAIPLGDGTLLGSGDPRLDTVMIRLGISF